ncbi:MAG TPA: thiamine ABC transporter substrate-binding protein, partial [Anaerolineae bacterium]|nr:thiamine ABC transporter substrate-binding protein [Anaerolineae bacterium]
MKKAVLWLLVVAMFASACATKVDKPTPTTEMRPTVTPLGATPAENEVTPVSPLATPEAAAVVSPLATPGASVAAASPLATPSGETRTLTVLTHESFALSDAVLQQFEQANNVKVQFIKQGDAGQALTRAILTKDAPEADVIFGVDNTFLSRALEADLLEPYQPIGLANVPQEFQLDSTRHLIPIDYGDVCLNYDKAYFEQKKLQPPQSLADLTKPEYKGLLVIENPAGSSPGLAFMLATISALGEDKWLDYWKQLKANGVKVVEDWNTAYYTEFSASSGKGPRPIVVSYASSPPAEVVFANPPIDQAPTAAITAPKTCFRQIELAGVLKGTKNRDLAEKWIDFMLSVPYQEDLPLNQFVYPVNPRAKLPDAFTKWSAVAAQPANLAPDVIAKNRDRWVEEWTNAV